MLSEEEIKVIKEVDEIYEGTHKPNTHMTKKLRKDHT